MVRSLSEGTSAALADLVSRVGFTFKEMTGLEPTPEHMEARPALVNAAVSIALAQNKTSRGW